MCYLLRQGSILLRLEKLWVMMLLEFFCSFDLLVRESRDASSSRIS